MSLWDFRTDFVAVAELVASQSPSMSGKVEGTLAANLKARGQGSGWKDIRRVMTGNGNLVMENGMLKDVNLADTVLKGVTGVPGLSNLIAPEVRQRYPSVFGVGDTEFEKLDAKLTIRNGAAHVRDLRLAARDYVLAGEGKYKLSNKLDMAVVMTLSEPLSDDLIASVKEARYLRNRDGRLEIPVRLRGSLPGVRPEPDLRVITRMVQRELIGGLLDSALGGEGREDGERQSSGEELLKRGLDSLFGGKDRKRR